MRLFEWLRVVYWSTFSLNRCFHPSEGLCRFQRQRGNEPEAEHGARAKRNCIFAPKLQRAGSAHRGAWRAMGEVASVASNETAVGRAENRRVEVKVLLNKGVAGS